MVGEKLSEGEKWAAAGVVAGLALAPFTFGLSLVGSAASAAGGAIAASRAEKEDC
jgi:hypothetical protein